MNLYESLGVEKNATQKEIKAAFRQKMIELHPDKNDGEHVDEFYQVQTAYDVLSDPEEKQMYDETGNYSTDPEFKKIRVKLYQIFSGIMFNLPESECIMSACRKQLRKDISLYEDKNRILNQRIRQVEKIAKRVKCKNKDNFILAALDSEIEFGRDRINLHKCEIEFAEKVIEYSHNYEYDAPKEHKQLTGYIKYQTFPGHMV